MATLHPNVFYFAQNASWSTNNSSEFWNKGNTVITVNNNKVLKTIYSPSPYDFIEPMTGAFTGFTKTGDWTTNSNQFNVSGIFNKGWNFYCFPDFVGSTIFFPALGIKDINNNATLSDIANGGFYWSAGPSSSTSCARYFGFYPGRIGAQYENGRSSGFSLRSVSE